MSSAPPFDPLVVGKEAVCEYAKELHHVARMLGRADVHTMTPAQRKAVESACADVARAALRLGLSFPVGIDG